MFKIEAARRTPRGPLRTSTICVNNTHSQATNSAVQESGRVRRYIRRGMRPGHRASAVFGPVKPWGAPACPLRASERCMLEQHALAA